MADGGAAASPRQRKRDAEATRLALLAAARDLMDEYGVDGTRTRDVAAKVGVNQALVYRYFGSKERLLAEAAGLNQTGEGTAALMEVPLAELPRMLLEETLKLGADAQRGDHLALLLPGASNGPLRDIVRDKINDSFGRVVASRLAGPSAQLRAELLAAVLAGVRLLRQRVGTPALAAAEHEELVAYFERLAEVLIAEPDTADQP